MKDYKGAANNAQALSKFVYSVQEVLNDTSEEMTDGHKVEKLKAMLSGPDVLPVAAGSRDGFGA